MATSENNFDQKFHGFKKYKLKKILLVVIQMLHKGNFNLDDSKQYFKKFKQNLNKLQNKHEKLNRITTVTFPIYSLLELLKPNFDELMDELNIDNHDLDEYVGGIDISNTCQAINGIEKEMNSFTKFYVESAIKECERGRKCFTPTEGPLKSSQTLKKWYERNMKWVNNFYQDLNDFLSDVRRSQFCYGKFAYVFW